MVRRLVAAWCAWAGVLGAQGVLMIAAHPDDENTDLLVYFAKGRRVRTGYLSLTRGEGGQNLIGPEQGDLLGLIRTQELLAARRLDGAEQLFTRAVDFGYSKSPEEALRVWGRGRTLAEIEEALRKVKPDVILLRWSGTPADGHGQHQASAILAKEAFARSGAKRMYRIDAKGEIEIDTGRYDAALGMSYSELAGRSRSLHRSQGMGAAEPKGSVIQRLTWVAGSRVNKDLLEDVAAGDPREPAELWAEAAASKPVYATGERIDVTVTAVNRSADDNRPARRAMIVRDPGELVRIRVGGIELVRPVVYRWVDPRLGERTRAVVVAPPVAVEFSERAVVFPSAASRKIALEVKANVPNAAGEAAIEVPAGWTVSPAVRLFLLTDAGEAVTFSFDVTPPASASQAELWAVARMGGVEYRRGMKTIDYDHISPVTVFPEAKLQVARTDARVTAKSVGYVMGAGDEAPQALRQLGVNVTLVEDLARAGLRQFDAVVTGVRAYNVRRDLRANQHRLLEYVAQGGTLVAQYNTLGEHREALERMGPYPIQVGRDRVSVEDSPMKAVDPNHPLLQRPNRISGKDYEGWVQERGLYFASNWDERYQPIWEAGDPGEKPTRGGTLYARYGKGVFIFTPMSWFRQLPAGVPGAYRIFANFVSAGRVTQ